MWDRAKRQDRIGLPDRSASVGESGPDREDKQGQDMGVRGAADKVIDTGQLGLGSRDRKARTEQLRRQSG
jgi:hypothetical protein